MSAYRQQAHLDAPLEDVWGLVGSPSRHPEWWPRVIEVRGERFEQGDEYAQVTKDPFGKSETTFLLERCRELHEIRMACQLTGMYAHWRLTPAQGGTFVDLEMGMQPRRVSDRVIDGTIGRIYFRRWADDSLDGLRSALVEGSAAHP